MPRDGSQNYVRPFPDVEEDTTIESAVYNGFTADVAIDLNHPRPILAGGTGADNKRDAMINLDGETSKQIVTNYDSHPWLPGSFYSVATPGQAAPVDGHAFSGIVYMSDASNITVEARDQSDTVVPGRLYVREKKAGVWGTWKLDGRFNAGDADGISSETADMFYGVRGVAPNSAFIVNTESDTTGTDVFSVLKNGFAYLKGLAAGHTRLVFDAAAAKANQISARVSGLDRWHINLGDGIAEGAGNTGSGFQIVRCDNAGAPIDAPISISRSTGEVAFQGATAATQAYVQSYVASWKPFQAGTMMVFHQSTAPVGWTRYTAAYDGRALRTNMTGTMGAGGAQPLSGISFNSGDTTLSAWATPGGLSVYGENTFTVYPGGNSNAYVAYAISGWADSGPNGGGGVPFLVGWGQLTAFSGYNGLSSAGGGSGGWHSHPISFSIQYLDVMLASRDA